MRRRLAWRRPWRAAAARPLNLAGWAALGFALIRELTGEVQPTNESPGPSLRGVRLSGDAAPANRGPRWKQPRTNRLLAGPENRQRPRQEDLGANPGRAVPRHSSLLLNHPQGPDSGAVDATYSDVTGGTPTFLRRRAEQPLSIGSYSAVATSGRCDADPLRKRPSASRGLGSRSTCAPGRRAWRPPGDHHDQRNRRCASVRRPDSFGKGHGCSG